MARLMTKEELNDSIKYRLECIAGLSTDIQKAIDMGLDLSMFYDKIEKADRLFAELFDLADTYKEKQ